MQNREKAFISLVDTIKKLRSENGCPWDKKQTIVSLTKYLQEEFDELLFAINNNDMDNLCEEAGDLLFLILMLAEINSEHKIFEIKDVLDTINEKLIRRHPHVFAGVQVKDEEALRKQWQMIKAEEKSKKN
jgi:tetrapyrrole methylase family protein / MazG family protein